MKKIILILENRVSIVELNSMKPPNPSIKRDWLTPAPYVKR
ncbi:MAG TPA: hypothetical protein PKL53_06245 [Methylotenera sp.]|nr:hypothetical protein [Methylotenera sp.]HPV43899.1 hypothetical protein [Methylotenera sp.]